MLSIILCCARTKGEKKRELYQAFRSLKIIRAKKKKKTTSLLLWDITLYIKREAMDSSSAASSPSPTPPQTGNRKLVLVTVGTTSFNPLIASVLKPSTMAALRSYGFTDMVVQYGNGRTAYDDGLKAAIKSENGPTIPTAALPLRITGFDFTDQMRFEVAKADLVISHAGMCYIKVYPYIHIKAI